LLDGLLYEFGFSVVADVYYDCFMNRPRDARVPASTFLGLLGTFSPYLRSMVRRDA